MENDGELTIVLKLPLADTPEYREKVIRAISDFVAESVTKITLDHTSLQ
jgi:hypothetical protein